MIAAYSNVIEHNINLSYILFTLALEHLTAIFASAHFFFNDCNAPADLIQIKDHGSMPLIDTHCTILARDFV